MTMAQRLQNIETTTQNQTIDNVELFFAGSAKTGLEGFLSNIARSGQSQGNILITKEKNPRSRKSGFATLSGELAILNAENDAGVYDRNNIGWIYMDANVLTIDQFRQEVTDFITDLQGEGLTVASKIGASIAELVISW